MNLRFHFRSHYKKEISLNSTWVTQLTVGSGFNSFQCFNSRFMCIRRNGRVAIVNKTAGRVRQRRWPSGEKHSRGNFLFYIFCLQNNKLIRIFLSEISNVYVFTRLVQREDPFLLSFIYLPFTLN